MDTTIRPGIANTIMGSMGSPREQAANANNPAVYLPRLATNILTTVSDTAPTVVIAPSNSGTGGTNLTPEQLSQLSLTVQPGSIVDANGNPVQNAQVGISPVPASLVMDMLPPGLMQHTFDITIQAPGGATFTTPAVLTMPNVFGAAPGTKLNILSFDHTTGRLVIDGTGTVSADGKTVISDPGSGVTAPGWHGMTPPGGSGYGGAGGGHGGKDDPCKQANADFEKALHDAELAGWDLSGTTGGLLGTLGEFGLKTFKDSLLVKGLNFAGLAGDVYSLSQDYDNLASKKAYLDAIKIVLDVASLVPIPGANALFGGLSTALGLFDVLGDIDKMADAAVAARLAHDQCTAQHQSSALGGAGVVGGGPIGGPSLLDADYNALLAAIDKAKTEFSAQKPLLLALAQAGTDITPIMKAFDPQNQAAGGLSRDQVTTLVDRLNTMTGAAGALASRPDLSVVFNGVIAAFGKYAADMTADMFTPVGGAVVRTFSNAAASTESAAFSTATADADTASAAQFGNRLYAALETSDGFIERFTFNPANGINHFLRADALYRLTVFDPTTLKIGSSVFTSAPSGSTTNIPLVGMADDLGAPLADGLTTTAAYVIGVNPNKRDNLVPGMTDLAVLQAGLDGAASLVTTTGVVASLQLQGEARAIALAGSVSNPARQTAYIATRNFGLAIVDVSTFQAPKILAQLPLQGNAVDVAVDSALGLAAVATGADGLQIVDVSDPTNPKRVTTAAVNASQVQVLDGIAYTSNGAAVDAIDLVTGQSLQHLLPGVSVITGLVLDGTSLYALDVTGTLKVIDVSTGAMVLRGSLTLPHTGTGLFAGDGVVYVGDVGTNPTRTVGGYLTVDVSNPDAPALISGPDAVKIAGTAIALNGSGLGVTVAGILSAGSVVNVVDVIDASNPLNTGQFLTRYPLPQQPYDVAIGSGVAFVADGLGGLEVVNYRGFDTQGAPPTITITQMPVDADPATSGIQVTEAQAVSLKAKISDDVQVANVQFLINGAVANTDVQYPWDLSAVLPTIAANGSDQVTLQVRAVDTGGNVKLSDPIPVQLVRDTTPPQLLSQSIADGATIPQHPRPFTFTFSEAIDAAAVNASNFTLFDPGGGGTEPNLNSIASRRPHGSADLRGSGAGQYQFDLNASQIVDRAGNALGNTTLATNFSVTGVDPLNAHLPYFRRNPGAHYTSARGSSIPSSRQQTLG